jgi:hypothetical protein
MSGESVDLNDPPGYFLLLGLVDVEHGYVDDGDFLEDAASQVRVPAIHDGPAVGFEEFDALVSGLQRHEFVEDFVH